MSIRIRIPAYILFFFIAALHGMPSLTIDSLSGKVEIQRSGKLEWKPAKQGMRFENNDCIRVLTNSVAFLKWPDGTLTFVHENSKLLINIIPGTNNNFICHVTISYGDFFFITKNSPSVNSSNEIKIYTPVSKAIMQGASFETKADSSGTTVVSVIYGTVNLSTLNSNASIYLSAPYKASISKSTRAITRSALVQNDIDSLKSWVPPLIIDAEIRNQLTKSRRDNLILKGKSAIECLVVPFDNVSNYKGNWQIGRVIASALAQKLKSAATLTNITFKDSSGDPLSVAGQSKVDYLITARIEHFDLVQQAEISANAEEYREFAIARVRIEMTLTDVHENKPIDQEILSGEVSTKNKNENTWATIGKMNFSLEDPTFSKSILGRAIQQALEQASEKVLKLIEM